MKTPPKSQAQVTALLETVDALGCWVRALAGRTARTGRRASATPPIPNHSLQLVSPDEAAQFLGVAKKTLSNWRGLGTGPEFVKIGGKVAYPRFALHLFVEHGRRGDPARWERAS